MQPTATTTRPAEATFRDRHGRDWALALNVGHLGAVKKALGLDLAGLIKDEGALFRFLFTDPELFSGVLFFLVQDQAEARGVDLLAFLGGIDGRTLEGAGEAFLAALALFSPRSAIGRAVAAGLPELLEKLDEAMLERLRQGRPPAEGVAPGNGTAAQ